MLKRLLLLNKGKGVGGIGLCGSVGYIKKKRVLDRYCIGAKYCDNKKTGEFKDLHDTVINEWRNTINKEIGDSDVIRDVDTVFHDCNKQIDGIIKKSTDASRDYELKKDNAIKNCQRKVGEEITKLSHDRDEVIKNIKEQDTEVKKEVEKVYTESTKLDEDKSVLLMVINSNIHKLNDLNKTIIGSCYINTPRYDSQRCNKGSKEVIIEDILNISKGNNDLQNKLKDNYYSSIRLMTDITDKTREIKHGENLQNDLKLKVNEKQSFISSGKSLVHSSNAEHQSKYQKDSEIARNDNLQHWNSTTLPQIANEIKTLSTSYSNAVDIILKHPGISLYNHEDTLNKLYYINYFKNLLKLKENLSPSCNNSSSEYNTAGLNISNCSNKFNDTYTNNLLYNSKILATPYYSTTEITRQYERVFNAGLYKNENNIFTIILRPLKTIYFKTRMKLYSPSIVIAEGSWGRGRVLKLLKSLSYFLTQGDFINAYKCTKYEIKDKEYTKLENMIKSRLKHTLIGEVLDNNLNNLI